MDQLAFAYLIPTPLPEERPASPSSRRAPWVRTDAAEDLTVPETMMARPGVDGQVRTGRSQGVSGGWNPYNRAITTWSVLATIGRLEAVRRSVPRRDRE